MRCASVEWLCKDLLYESYAIVHDVCAVIRVCQTPKRRTHVLVVLDSCCFGDQKVEGSLLAVVQSFGGEAPDRDGLCFVSYLNRITARERAHMPTRTMFRLTSAPPPPSTHTHTHFGLHSDINVYAYYTNTPPIN